MNNINPFLNNGINSRQNVANQNNGALNYNVRFGNGQNYDSFESSSNEKTKSFWQKWKGIIIGGAGLLCVSILGVIGYNKGWFKKAGDKIKEITGKTSSKAASNAQENVQSLGKYLETLGLTNKKIDDGTKIKDLLTTPTKKITQRQFFNVARKVNKDLNLSDSTKTQAAVIILEQLRKNLANDVNIDNFNKDTEINNTNLQEILKNILKAEEKEITNKLDGSKNLQESWQEFTESKEEEKSSKVNNVADALDSAIYDEVINQEHKELVQDILSNLKEYITPDNADAVADALDSAIDKEIINQEHKELVQGILSKFNEKGVITSFNTNAVTSLLITAKAKGVVNDDTTYNNMINSCISTNTGAVVNALDNAIQGGFINNKNDNGVVQDILSKLFNKDEIKEEDIYSEASLLITAKAKGFDVDNYDKMIDSCISTNPNVVLQALDFAIQYGVINNDNEDNKDNKDNKQLVQGILTQFKENNVITPGNTDAVARVLGLAINKGIINKEEHKELVQGILSKFNEKGVITSFNTNAVTSLLITAKAKGFDVDSNIYDNMINSCISTDAFAVADALGGAIYDEIINQEEEHKKLVQDILSNLKEYITPGSTYAVARVLGLAINKGIINQEDEHKELVQDILSKFRENNVITQDNTDIVADALDSAIRYGFINNQNDDNGLVQGIISKFNNQEVITSYNTDAVARALDSAIRYGFINNQNDDNGLVQGIISKFNNQEVITSYNTDAVARALDSAIQYGFINNQNDDNGLVQGILTQLQDKTKYNEHAVTSLLITAKAKGFDVDSNIYDNMINSCISANTDAVARALDSAIQGDFINDDDNGLVQGILSKLNEKGVITEDNTFAVADALDWAIYEGIINQEHKELVQGILSKFRENNVITQDNTDIVARALDSAIRYGVINNENQDHKLLVQDIIKRLISLTTDITCSSLGGLIKLAKNKDFINDDDIEKMQEE